MVDALFKKPLWWIDSRVAPLIEARRTNRRYIGKAQLVFAAKFRTAQRGREALEWDNLMANRDHIGWLLEGVESWNRRRDRMYFRPDLSDANIADAFKSEGRLTDDGRIPLAGVNLSDANLRGAHFSGHRGILFGDAPMLTADLTEANFSRADCQNVLIHNSKLDRASFLNTKFDDADLSGSNMRECHALWASFRGTDLSESDFAGARVVLSSFDGANLYRAHLRDTDLTTANLVRACVEGSRLWEAKLFRTKDESSMPSIDSEHITCVADLIRVCAKLDEAHDANLLYLRGERTNAWELRPSVMRRGKDDAIKLRTKEGDMLLDLMTMRPTDFSASTTALDQWVLAQHHGLKTRLLDVTRNPLVALFAACDSDSETGRLHFFLVPRSLVKPFNSSTIAVLTNFAKLSHSDQDALVGRTGESTERQGSAARARYKRAMDRLYGLIRQEKPDFERRISPLDFFRVLIVQPQQSFERVRAQSGAFLVSGFHERFEQTEITNWNPMIPVYDHLMLDVPPESKQQIRSELRMLNISRETLYPGLDEAAKAVLQNAIR